MTKNEFLYLTYGFLANFDNPKKWTCCEKGCWDFPVFGSGTKTCPKWNDNSLMRYDYYYATPEIKKEFEDMVSKQYEESPYKDMTINEARELINKKQEVFDCIARAAGEEI